jgi:hypothetical protein
MTSTDAVPILASRLPKHQNRRGTKSDTRKILVPYDRHEAISLKVAAERAGRAQSTIRNWCDKYGIGRMVGGLCEVSKVALVMYLENDFAALAAYHRGERNSELVGPYFKREGI